MDEASRRRKKDLGRRDEHRGPAASNFLYPPGSPYVAVLMERRKTSAWRRRGLWHREGRGAPD